MVTNRRVILCPPLVVVDEAIEGKRPFPVLLLLGLVRRRVDFGVVGIGFGVGFCGAIVVAVIPLHIQLFDLVFVRCRVGEVVSSKTNIKYYIVS